MLQVHRFLLTDNCKNMSIRSIRHTLRDKPYADRVFDNNYRGDFVTEVKAKPLITPPRRY